MASFKVIALSLGGLRNKIFQSGDVVTQEQLPVSVDELVDKGFLVPCESVNDDAFLVDSDSVNDEAIHVEEPSIMEVLQSALETEKKWPSIDEMTIASIKEALGENAPKKQMPKAELYAMLVG